MVQFRDISYPGLRASSAHRVDEVCFLYNWSRVKANVLGTHAILLPMGIQKLLKNNNNDVSCFSSQKKVESLKFLGVHKLKWSTHTDSVVKKVQQCLFNLRRL
jgi:hypothetical protein